MNIKEKLIEEITLKINEIDKICSKEEQDKIIELKNSCYNFFEKIKKNINLTKEDINSINISLIKEIFPDIQEDIINKLEHPKSVLNILFYNINNQKNIKNMTEAITALLTKIKEKEEKIKITTEEKNILQEILNNLTNNYEDIFDKEKINIIIEYLKKQGKTEIEILRFIKELANDVENTIIENKSNRKDTEEEFEELKENEENIEIIKQKIIDILNKYGYSDIISYFSDELFANYGAKERNRLFKFGKINNIEEIIKTFKEYNINILEEIENGNLKKIFILLCDSKAKNVKTLFDLALDSKICIYKRDENGNIVLDETGKPQINFSYLLEHLSIFLNRKRTYSKQINEQESHTPTPNDIVEIGMFEDFVENINFLKNLGVDIPGLFKKFDSQNRTNGTFLTTPHKIIKYKQKIFEWYKIKKEQYLKTFSCFTRRKGVDTIDLLIELDLFDYLKENVSIIAQKSDLSEPLFYRIAKIRQLHKEKAKGIIINTEKNKINRKNIEEYTPEITKKRKEIQTKYKNFRTNEAQKEVLRVSYEEVNHWKLHEKSILTTEQQENFKNFDKLIAKYSETPIDITKFNETVLKKINSKSKKDKEYDDVLEFETTNNKIRISKRKFYRIYNILCQLSQNLEYDKDCVLYALTYNSILSIEEFEAIKSFIENDLFKNITQTSGRSFK